MITTFQATTKPNEVSAIFYDGVDHEKVVNWLGKKGISAVYEYSSHCILAYRNDSDLSVSLRPGMVLVVDYILTSMAETAFRSMYNIESELHL